MEGFLLFFYPFLAIVQFIAIICFFYLCKNIHRIRKKLTGGDREYHLRQYYKYVSFGDDQRALDALRELIYMKMLSVHHTTFDKDYEALKALYKPHFDRCGATFPKPVKA